MDVSAQKTAAAEAALDWVEPGMHLGLGSGSTAAAFVDVLGDRVAKGLDVVGVPTSEATRSLAVERGIRLTTLDETSELDLCVDGADEVGPDLVLIKGGGGALTREKIVAQASAKMITIVDHSKVVDPLGAFPLPLEILPFGATTTITAITRVLRAHGINTNPRVRQSDGSNYITDNGNLIVDCDCGVIREPAALAASFSGIAGIVEHGLFIDICSAAIVASPDGVSVRTKPNALEMAV
ncbi:MAG: ribose-5-phosphate isomerase RpiA [Pseudomonadota bacterium]